MDKQKLKLKDGYYSFEPTPSIKYFCPLHKVENNKIRYFDLTCERWTRYISISSPYELVNERLSDGTTFDIKPVDEEYAQKYIDRYKMLQELKR